MRRRFDCEPIDFEVVCTGCKEKIFMQPFVMIASFQPTRDPEFSEDVFPILTQDELAEKIKLDWVYDQPHVGPEIVHERIPPGYRIERTEINFYHREGCGVTSGRLRHQVPGDAGRSRR